MKLVLVGRPGAGKSTHSGFISQKYDVEHINVGSILKKNGETSTPDGTIDEIMASGKLVPKPIVNELVMESVKSASDYVLDGFPRTLSQAQLLLKDDDPDMILNIVIPPDTAINRVRHRRICSECRTIYNIKSNPPSESGKCDTCAGTLIHRNDDTMEVAQTRIETFNKETSEVIEYFENYEKCIPVNGNQPIPDVRSEIYTHINHEIS